MMDQNEIELALNRINITLEVVKNLLDGRGTGAIDESETDELLKYFLTKIKNRIEVIIINI